MYRSGEYDVYLGVWFPMGSPAILTHTHTYAHFLASLAVGIARCCDAFRDGHRTTGMVQAYRPTGLLYKRLQWYRPTGLLYKILQRLSQGQIRRGVGSGVGVMSERTTLQVDILPRRCRMDKL